MAKVNYAAISRVNVRDAAEIFQRGRSVADLAADCCVEAMRVLHDGLSNPDDKLRLMSANALIVAHCKLATAAMPQSAAPALPTEERVARLTEALRAPDAELRQAMQAAGLATIVPSGD